MSLPLLLASSCERPGGKPNARALTRPGPSSRYASFPPPPSGPFGHGPKASERSGAGRPLSPECPDRPAHLSIQIPVPNRSFVEHATRASESPVFAPFLDSTLVTIDSE
jgi:hypothetical protein